MIKPREFPKLKEQFAQLFKNESLTLAQQGATQEEILSSANIAFLLNQAEMIWVSQDMTALTQSACQDLPADTANYPAEDAGLVIFEGSTGLTTAMNYLPPEDWTTNAFGQKTMPRAKIDGVIWSYVKDLDEAPLFLAISITPMAYRGQPDNGDLSFALPLEISADVYQDVLSLMKTMWLLTSQGDIVQEEKVQVVKAGGKKRAAQTTKNNAFVRLVSLKQTKHEYTPAKDAKGKWQLDHRVIVRGHWRQQAHGKNHEERRPVYIRPYIKGPEGKRLVIRPTVKIWNK